MYVVRNHTPDHKLIHGGNMYWFVLVVVRNKPGTITVFVNLILLEHKFAVDGGNDEIAILRIEAAVNDKYVAIENTCINHRLTTDTGVESGLRMLVHLTDDVNTFAGVVGSRRRKAGMDRIGKVKFKALEVRIRYIGDFHRLLFYAATFFDSVVVFFDFNVWLNEGRGVVEAKAKELYRLATVKPVLLVESADVGK